jgi:hypothetical protein
MQDQNYEKLPPDVLAKFQQRVQDQKNLSPYVPNDLDSLLKVEETIRELIIESEANLGKGHATTEQELLNAKEMLALTQAMILLEKLKTSKRKETTIINTFINIAILMTQFPGIYVVDDPEGFQQEIQKYIQTEYGKPLDENGFLQPSIQLPKSTARPKSQRQSQRQSQRLVDDENPFRDVSHLSRRNSRIPPATIRDDVHNLLPPESVGAQIKEVFEDLGDKIKDTFMPSSSPNGPKGRRGIRRTFSDLGERISNVFKPRAKKQTELQTLKDFALHELETHYRNMDMEIDHEFLDLIVAIQTSKNTQNARILFAAIENYQTSDPEDNPQVQEIIRKIRSRDPIGFRRTFQKISKIYTNQQQNIDQAWLNRAIIGLNLVKENEGRIPADQLQIAIAMITTKSPDVRDTLGNALHDFAFGDLDQATRSEIMNLVNETKQKYSKEFKQNQKLINAKLRENPPSRRTKVKVQPQVKSQVKLQVKPQAKPQIQIKQDANDQQLRELLIDNFDNYVNSLSRTSKIPPLYLQIVAAGRAIMTHRRTRKMVLNPGSRTEGHLEDETNIPTNNIKKMLHDLAQLSFHFQQGLSRSERKTANTIIKYIKTNAEEKYAQMFEDTTRKFGAFI